MASGGMNPESSPPKGSPGAAKAVPQMSALPTSAASTEVLIRIFRSLVRGGVVAAATLIPRCRARSQRNTNRAPTHAGPLPQRLLAGSLDVDDFAHWRRLADGLARAKLRGRGWHRARSL